MDTGDWLAVTQAQALRFFFERLRDVVGEDEASSSSELLYNASVLAHFATTSAAATSHFPGTPTSLSTVFDVFVLDRSQHVDPEIMEAAASQCLFLTGFFQDQLQRRYNLAWYASLGAGFYDSAAEYATDRARSRMMQTMASRFEYWRRHQHRLAGELRDWPRLIVVPRQPQPDLIFDDDADE
jgi:hypothetical protein